jgi:hypothetical protein
VLFSCKETEKIELQTISDFSLLGVKIGYECHKNGLTWEETELLAIKSIKESGLPTPDPEKLKIFEKEE